MYLNSGYLNNSHIDFKDKFTREFPWNTNVFLNRGFSNCNDVSPVMKKC